MYIAGKEGAFMGNTTKTGERSAYMGTTTKTGEAVKTVHNALEIIEILATGHENLRLTTISEKSGINKTSTYKILSTLADFGYVQKDELTNRYRLGNKLLDMPSYILAHSDFSQIAMPFMKEIHQQTGQTINLMMLVGAKGYYAAVLRSPEYTCMNRIGEQEHLYATALGKAILSNLPPARVKEILQADPPIALVDKTIVDSQALYEELESTRKRGFAIDDEESRVNARCISAPIFNCEGVLGAISISGNASQISIRKLFEYSSLITKTAKDLSKRLCQPI